ncbi:MAG: thioredoxin domain-containing protein [Bacteriovoracaceae bacterium]|nr:thioredoxin domain-containing protein [Bacteriovoracaceae bacterium]
MEREKSLTLKGMTRSNIALIVVGIGMIIASGYLIAHFFETFYPEGLSTSSVCDVSGFFSCDAIAYSPIATIFSIPISVFGLLAGLFLVISSFFPSENLERTNHLLGLINVVLCLILFIYSIVGLNHLCPFCTVYYILSAVAYFLFFKYGIPLGAPSYKVLGIYALVTIIVSGIFLYTIHNKKELIAKQAPLFIEQFYSYPDLGKPKQDLAYRLYSSTPNFSDAPIQITVFSDFQCPACKMLHSPISKIKSKYKGKINIQYSFYPLDNACNPKMTQALHTVACQASYLASCLPTDFARIHDELFEHQDELSVKWLNSYAQKEGATQCMNDIQTKEKIVKIIDMAGEFNVRSTPTLLINGVKIEGVLPLAHYYIILDEIVKRSKQ